MENEQADAGRDCRNRLARPNSQARNADREILTFPVQLTTSRIGNLTRLFHTLAICVTIHTCPKNVYRWDHRLQRQSLFMAFKRVPLCMLVTLGRQYNVGEKPTVVLYTYYINRHAGTPNKTKQNKNIVV